MIEEIGRKPIEPTPSGDAIADAMKKKKFQVELRSYNKRLAEYQAELAERKAAGLPPKAQEQTEPEKKPEPVDKAAEAKKKAEKQAAAKKAAEEAAERRRLHDEERKKNDPFLKKMEADREAKAEAKQRQEEEEAVKEQALEETRMLECMEAEEAAKASAAAKVLADAAAKKEAEAVAKIAKEAETALDIAMRRMFSREDPDADAKKMVPPEGFCPPSGRWDDGATCFDKPEGLTLYCSRCGNRPRPEHDFRCRLHDEELSNGDDRPMYPANVEDKMAMRRYAKDMDEWKPSWLEADDDEPPEIDDERVYPLHCPRCESKTERCGTVGIEFSTNLEIIVKATEWLPSSYPGAVNAPEPTIDRRFLTNVSLWGHCRKCKLLVTTACHA